jgi:hypothetical protein
MLTLHLQATVRGNISMKLVVKHTISIIKVFQDLSSTQIDTLLRASMTKREPQKGSPHFMKPIHTCSLRTAASASAILAACSLSRSLLRLRTASSAATCENKGEGRSGG